MKEFCFQRASNICFLKDFDCGRKLRSASKGLNRSLSSDLFSSTLTQRQSGRAGGFELLEHSWNTIETVGTQLEHDWNTNVAPEAPIIIILSVCCLPFAVCCLLFAVCGLLFVA